MKVNFREYYIFMHSLITHGSPRVEQNNYHFSWFSSMEKVKSIVMFSILELPLHRYIQFVKIHWLVKFLNVCSSVYILFINTFWDDCGPCWHLITALWATLSWIHAAVRGPDYSPIPTETINFCVKLPSFRVICYTH